jgi:hypothetical protein
MHPTVKAARVGGALYAEWSDRLLQHHVCPQQADRVFFRGAGFLSVFDQPQRDALAMLFLRLHGSGIGIAEILWGPFFIPFGLLVMRSVSFPASWASC